jgi:hypothetical protein
MQTKTSYESLIINSIICSNKGGLKEIDINITKQKSTKLRELQMKIQIMTPINAVQFNQSSLRFARYTISRV